jgi:hypothetical protein
MTTNKTYNISILCRLRRILVDSDEAQEFQSWTILKLLNAIKQIRETRVVELCDRKKVEVDSKQGKTIGEWTVSKLMDTLDEPEEEDFDVSITRRVGCVHI